MGEEEGRRGVGEDGVLRDPGREQTAVVGEGAMGLDLGDDLGRAGPAGKDEANLEIDEDREEDLDVGQGRDGEERTKAMAENEVDSVSRGPIAFPTREEDTDPADSRDDQHALFTLLLDRPLQEFDRLPLVLLDRKLANLIRLSDDRLLRVARVPLGRGKLRSDLPKVVERVFGDPTNLWQKLPFPDRDHAVDRGPIPMEVEKCVHDL